MITTIFTKEKAVAPGEKIGMILQKHTIDEIPPRDKELLLLINLVDNTDANIYFWTVGQWSGIEWICPFDEIGYYAVIEWYELPKKNKINEDFSYHQMRMEEFWNDK